MSLVKPFYCEKCKKRTTHVNCDGDYWRCMTCMEVHEVVEESRWGNAVLYDGSED